MNQTHQKFRCCMVACRAAALKIKTSSRIKWFQESKDYGEWFSKLIQYLVTTDSCQCGQAIEPSAIEHQASPNISGNDFLYQVSVNDTSSSSSPSVNEESSKTKRKHFVPDWESRNKIKKKESIENVFGELNNTLNEIKKSLSNDGISELLQFLKKDSKKQAKRDMFLNLMSQMVQSHSIHSTVSSVPSYPSPYPTQVPQTPLPSQQKLLTTNPTSPTYNCSQSQQFSKSCYGMSSHAVNSRFQQETTEYVFRRNRKWELWINNW